jgi:hypothetical protein
MKLNAIAANQTEVEIAGNTVFFSYKTPVAANLAEGGLIRTNKRWSVTTSRHINKWLAGASAKEVDQSVLDNLIA